MKTIKLAFIFVMAIAINAHAQKKKEIKNYSFKETHKVKKNTKLTIDSFDGDIAITSHDKNTIEIYYFVKQGDKTLKIESNLVEKEINNKNGNFVLKITGVNIRKNPNKSVYVDLKLFIPKLTNTTLFTEDGDIVVSNLTGNQTCETGDGDFRFQNIIGNTTAKTQDGDMNLSNLVGNVLCKSGDGDLHFSNIVGNIQTKTSDGDIHLSDIKGNVAAKSGDGDIIISNVTGELVTKTSDGEVIQMNSK